LSSTKTLEGFDLFCGTGVVSEAMRQALRARGYDIHITAVNHWKVAIATYERNIGPGLCRNLEDVKPIELIRGGHVDIGWASPECTYHSRARGRKPMSDQLRVSPWLINRWLTDLDVDRFIVENVPEFVDWGPMLYAKDCVPTRGHDTHCQRHNQSIAKCAKMDGERPDPTRKGVFFQAWRQSLIDCGYDVDWKVLTCADYGDPTTRRRFFLIARKDGRPLRWPMATHAPRNAGRRTMFGNLKPYRAAAEVLDLNDRGPSIYKADGTVRLSVNTQMRVARGARLYWGNYGPWYINMLDIPQAAKNRYIAECGTDWKPGEPFVIVAEDGAEALEPFIFVRDRFGLASPVLVTLRGTKGYQIRSTAKPLTEPIGAISAGGIHHAIATPQVVPYGPTAEARSAKEPLPTVMTKDRLAVATPFITPRLQEREGQHPRTHGIDDPMPTVTTECHHNLVTPLLITVANTSREDDGVNRSSADPLPTLTIRNNIAVATAELRTWTEGLDVDPRRLGFVTTDGITFVVVVGDIGYRMLKPLPELAGAHSFPPDYKFVGTQADITKQIGNSVPLETARALFEAMLDDLPVLTDESTEAVA
jgi:DNA (cytosine-5)-methyltransferase 1